MSKTEQFLTSVEKRLKAATPGKWDDAGNSLALYSLDFDDDDDFTGHICTFNEPDEPTDNENYKNDCALIMNCKEDLEKAVKALRVAIDGLNNHGVSHPFSNAALKEIESILGEE